MSKPWKLFPMKLPENFHGRKKPQERLSDVNRSTFSQRENPQFVQVRIGHWQRKKLDRDVQQQRRDFVCNSSKISDESPTWFKNTYHHYLRDNYNQRNRDKIVSHTEGFGRTRDEGFRNTSVFSESRRIWRQPPVCEKINTRDASLTGTKWMATRQDVTPKVGSTQTRDYTIRRPHLKVGMRQADNFINTYSVA